MSEPHEHCEVCEDPARCRELGFCEVFEEPDGREQEQFSQSPPERFLRLARAM